MKKNTLLLLIATVFLVSSCGNQRAIVTSKSITQRVDDAKPNYTVTSHLFLRGIFQEQEHNVSKVCQNEGGIAVVENKITALNQVVALLTLGIYTPRTTAVYCEASLVR